MVPDRWLGKPGPVTTDLGDGSAAEMKKGWQRSGEGSLLPR